MKRYGFTGTRRGLTMFQKDALRQVLEHGLRRFGKVEVYHGDCIGADAQFDTIAADLNVPRFLLPSDIEAMRAHCERRGAIVIEPPARPLKRNDRIVSLAEVMIGCPETDYEVLKSGTWATIRRTRKAKRPLVLIFPSRVATES